MLPVEQNTPQALSALARERELHDKGPCECGTKAADKHARVASHSHAQRMLKQWYSWVWRLLAENNVKNQSPRERYRLSEVWCWTVHVACRPLFLGDVGVATATNLQEATDLARRALLW